jgi:hypothetical protein
MARLKDKIASLRDQMRKFKRLEVAVRPVGQADFLDRAARERASSPTTSNPRSIRAII